MEQYKGYTISEIDQLRGTVTFTNGEVISTGDIVGDISEKDMRRIQIRETILSHFEKEEKLFDKGIKCLSLFFIDEVAKYRQYDENGDEVLGEYGKMFEQEYINVLNEYVTLLDTPYQRYLKSTCSDVSEVHKGYFSIDKKGHAIDSKVKRGSEFSDDISAYDLILKNKERLLSFDEPTRFIFSHSALREGWDNPNVFQICTLKHSDSNTAKRQEVGRGLRLCVNQNGNRIDVENCGETVHDINVLTVVASESYKTFVTDLQSDIKTVLYDRPTVATSEYFKGKYIKVDDVPMLIDDETANAIEFYLIQNGYVDMKRKVTDKYRQEIKSGTVAELPDELKPMAEGIHTLIQSVYDDSILQDMFTDGHGTKVKDNPLNDNFAKKEFQALWREINHKTDWFDVGGTANNKYVEEQGEFLLHKLKEMIDKNPKILDKKEKDVVYVITPFSNVAYQLSQKLRKIHFTRYDEQGKPTNVGTVHTFQGKEAPIVFFVLGADRQSSGAARWAVTEANIMNVAATRAKEEFYIIGDRKLYLGLECDVATDTDRIIREYKNQYLVDDHAHKNELRMQVDETRTLVIDADFRRITGTVKYVGKGTESFYAYVVGADGKEYFITESTYSKTENAIEVIQKGKKISFIPGEWNKKLFATEVKMDA